MVLTLANKQQVYPDISFPTSVVLLLSKHMVAAKTFSMGRQECKVVNSLKQIREM